MISFIQGTVEHVLDASVIIGCNGLGYEINVSPATIGRLPSVSSGGSEVRLYTRMQVSEDAVSLYGFLSLEELQMFNLLQRVSGVGAKVALSLLASLSPQRIMIAILADDSDELSKAPGVGKKTAQRISLELKDKIKSRDEKVSGLISAQQSITSGSSETGDAMDALVALGYGKAEAVRAVAEVAAEGMKAEQMIRLGLKKMAGR
ncbi:MAG: Holliday junction branch migration protein RuvA [Defluviitaleaceae bacterium]|nr:Holliday junction branch migration protein RuvA [Defluviitaleaceae bacterium]